MLDSPVDENLAHLDFQYKLVRKFQTDRLANTYSDFLELPRYRPACIYFLTDIYGAQDFTKRDQELERMYKFIRLVLPPKLVESVGYMIELNTMVRRLDYQVASVLVNELGVASSLTANQYAEAFRRCDNYVERMEQVRNTIMIITLVDEVVKQPMAGTSLRLARGPAEKAGWGDLYSFFARGYAAFKHMGGAEHFIATIRSREIRILDQIFSAENDPFNVNR